MTKWPDENADTTRTRPVQLIARHPKGVAYVIEIAEEEMVSALGLEPRTY